jgi:hypothetical protein
MSSVLIIPEQNEGRHPLYVAEQGLQSGRVKAVFIVDGWSTDGTFAALQEDLPQLQKRYPEAQIEVMRSELRETGKGGAMVTGMKYALTNGFRNVVFLDGDITSVTPRWITFLLENMERHRASMARGYFDRSTLDAQITRHITRPLMAIYFPEGRQIQQPLGGELVLTAELASHLLREAPTAPPHHWGIDTFLTVNTVAGGFSVVEVYLTQKVHKKKSLTELRSMLIECFDEMCKEIAFHGRYGAVPDPKVNLVVVTPKENSIERVGGDVRSLQYADLEEQRERFFTFVRGIRQPKTRLRELGLDREERDLVLSLFDRRRFNEESSTLNGELWVSLIDRLARGYIERGFSPIYHDVIFACWTLRALSFAHHEAETFEAGEEATERQAEVAFQYGARYRV